MWEANSISDRSDASLFPARSIFRAIYEVSLDEAALNSDSLNLDRQKWRYA